MIVTLSVIMAIITSFTTLDLVSRVVNAKGKSKFMWLLLASCVMGIGVWSMHFIGMISFKLPIQIHYDIGLTLLSILCILTSSIIAFWIVSQKNIKKWKILIGGFFIGLGIVTMHYLGMAAMKMEAFISYSKPYFFFSCFIAFFTSFVALFLFHRFRQTTKTFSLGKITSSFIMGVAISGMHYTGMKATQFCLPIESTEIATTGLDNQFLVIIVSLTTFLIFAIGLGAEFFDRKVLENLAYRDTLTGLNNRNSFVTFLETKTDSDATGFMYVDLDGFKLVNDTLGHDVGDLVLIEIAKRISSIVRHDGHLYRIGGDEFVFVSHSTKIINRTKLEMIALRVLSEVAEPLILHDQEYIISASIGIALSTSKDQSIPLPIVYKNADIAMYYAKKNGKNHYEFYSEKMSKEISRTALLTKKLRSALVNKELSVHYQPQYDLSKGRIIGVEALLRWNQKEQGLISPAEFIPIAEEYGMITNITKWILERVIEDYHVWNQKWNEDFSVSINLSVKTLLSNEIIPLLEEIETTKDLDLRFLELEVTEGIAMHNREYVLKQLEQIRAKGIKISMDDFGTGYSSLSYLKKFPIQKLKIDRSFLQGIPEDHMDQALVTSIISIAQNLGLEVIAEGVETEEQVKFLSEKNCYQIQGYWYSKPLPMDEVTSLLKNNLKGSA